MTMEKPNVTLRAPEPDDLDFLYLLENDEAARESTPCGTPVSRQQLWQYLHDYDGDIAAQHQLRLMVCGAAGARLGAVDIYDYSHRDRRAYVGIAIAPDCRRHGYGAAALEAVCAFAADVLGMHQLAAVVTVDNAASRRLFAACGFKPCGRLRSWRRRGTSYADALVLQRLFV